MPIRCLLLLVALCVACNSSSKASKGDPKVDAGADSGADQGDAGALDEGDIARDYCAPLARLVCERADGCGCGALVPGGQLDTKGCTARWTGKCLHSYAPYLSAVAMGKARVIKSRAVQCISLIETLTPGCEQPRGLVSFSLCEPFVVSDTPVGKACDTVPVCAGGSGVCAKGTCITRGEKGATCESEYECATGFACIMGSCRELSGAAKSCEDDNGCAPALRCVRGACTALSAEGKACEETTECAQGLVCSAKKCAVPVAVCVDDTTCGNRSTCGAPRACAPRSGAGAPCKSDGECSGDLYCGSSSKCIGLPGLDEPCANGASCASGLACDPPGAEDPRCRVLPGEGKPCGLTSNGPVACAEGLGCSDGLCKVLPGEAATCTNDNRCASGLACDFTASGSFCVAPKPTGGACQNDVVCGPSGHCGDEGLCGPDLADGESCDPNLNECDHVCERDPTFGFSCAAPRAEGDACVFDDECPTSLACVPQLAKASCIAEVCEVLP